MREKSQDHVLMSRRMFRYVLIALLGFLWFLAVLITQYFYRLFFSSGNIYNCLYSPLFTSVTVTNFTYKVGRKKKHRFQMFVFCFFLSADEEIIYLSTRQKNKYPYLSVRLSALVFKYRISAPRGRIVKENGLTLSL